MKLVKIKDVRVGQVWINDQTGLIHTVDDLGSNADKAETTKTRDEYLKSAKCRLIGKLGITHKIEDNKLLEIPRDEFQIDDVVNVLNVSATKKINAVVVAKIGHQLNTFDGKGYNGYYTDDETSKFMPEKIGIYGVTHEFINDCEVPND